MASVIAYSTDSAGMHPSHTLPLKLQAIAEAGISQVELGFPDLEAYAAQEFPGYKKLDDRGQGDIDKLLETAGKIRALCGKLELSVLLMHPYAVVFVEVLTIRRLRGCGQAGEGLREGGILVQSAQARAYADPTSTTGLLPSAQETLNASLSALTSTIPSSKIFYLQVSDAARTDARALCVAAEKQGIPPLYAYSNEWRPLPFMSAIEPGQRWEEYLPVVDVCEAVLKTGWRGPWSFEVFYRKDMARDDPDVPTRWTRAAVKSYEKILEQLKQRGIPNRVLAPTLHIVGTQGPAPNVMLLTIAIGACKCLMNRYGMRHGQKYAAIRHFQPVHTARWTDKTRGGGIGA
ncbi:hypothetical protein OBBRIDRAFT_823729, partial [Obba rivulosa]